MFPAGVHPIGIFPTGIFPHGIVDGSGIPPFDGLNFPLTVVISANVRISAISVNVRTAEVDQ